MTTLESFISSVTVAPFAAATAAATADPSTVYVTHVTNVTAIPPSPTPSTSQGGGLSSAAIAGLSLSGGLLVGLLAALLFLCIRYRRNPRTRIIPVNRDAETLLDAEKQPRMDSPFYSQPSPAPNAKILDWVQGTRAASITSVATSYFPTIETISTLSRSQSIGAASSRSAYSQASAFPSRRSEENYHDPEGLSRPPDLYRINE